VAVKNSSLAAGRVFSGGEFVALLECALVEPQGLDKALGWCLCCHIFGVEVFLLSDWAFGKDPGKASISIQPLGFRV
jgi:hypothetical protein